MADALNPRQFISLDYNNADMYSGLNQRPSTATPLNIPLRLTNDKPTGNQSATEQAYYKSEEIRRQTEYKQQRASQDAKEQALKEREIARNQAANASRPAPPEQPTVSSRDYEKKFIPPTTNDSNQSTPSTGSTPPTIRQTSARGSSLVEPTATPAGVALAEAIPVAATGGILSQLPRALPQAAGRLAVPGVLGGIDFAQRVIRGQSVGHAATSAIAFQVGAVTGFAIGSAVGGPLLGYALGAVGGMVTGAIADSFFHDVPAPAATPKEPPSYPPLDPGQVTNALYHVRWNVYDPNGNLYGVVDDRLFGKLNALVYTSTVPSRATMICGGSYNDSPNPRPGSLYLFPFAPAGWLWKQVLCEQETVGTPDPPQIFPAPPPDNLPYNYAPSPIGDDNTVPTGRPAAGTNKGKTRNVAPSLPSNNTPRGAPFFPGHGGLAPSSTPNPTQTPDNLGGMLPAAAPTPRQPLPFAEPDDVGIPVSASGNASRIENGVVTNPPTSNAQPIPLNSSRVTVPSSSSPVPGRQNATPDAVSPTPKSDTAPIPKTPTEVQAKKTAETIEQQKKDFEKQISQLTGIAAIIAGLTPAIQGIPDAIANSPAVQAATGTTVQGAVCEIAQPGGCLGNALDNSANKVNQNNNQNAANILDAVNTGANAALLAGQETILARLGAQLPGGIGGKLSRFADWMHLDRVLNILILAATIHNALMLSNDIEQTLIGAINNVLQSIGLKKEDGSSFDIGSVISSSVENLIKGAIGADNYVELKEAWAKANRIYQATNNVINNFLNLSQTILQASELIAAYTGKIGNALKKGGVILENAYGWMNPQPKFNRVTNFLENLQNGASTIQMVTQAPLDIVNATAELTTASTEFVKAVKEDDKTQNKTEPVPEPDELKAKEIQSKTSSQPNPFDFSDLFDGED